ncbi:MAG TPA: hypothetical protein VIL55_15870 [Naasia sp.]|jgi:hypothetical protein
MAVPKWASRRARERAAPGPRDTDSDAALAAAPGDQVEEGVMIATSAIRLAAKNDLILRAFRDGTDYNAEAMAQLVRGEILALAEEKEQDATRADEVRRAVRRRWGRARHQHDYRRADRELLERREQVNSLLAARLRALCDDRTYVRTLADQARDAALDEIAYSMRDKARALHSTAMVDEDYPIARTLRMQMIAHDLEELERTRGGTRWV